MGDWLKREEGFDSLQRGAWQERGGGVLRRGGVTPQFTLYCEFYNTLKNTNFPPESLQKAASVTGLESQVSKNCLSVNY